MHIVSDRRYITTVHVVYVDINECVENNVVCPDNQQCEDKEGSYECVCKAGYKKVRLLLTSLVIV